MHNDQGGNKQWQKMNAEAAQAEAAKAVKAEAVEAVPDRSHRAFWKN